MLRILITCLALLLPDAIAETEHQPVRARELGVPFSGTPGKYNAITDVPGLLVGHTTLIEGDGPLVVGEGPVRTGVTAILPLGRDTSKSVSAGRAVINGTGEMTGSWLIDEMGIVMGPIMLTGTANVGIVHHATSKWVRDRLPPELWPTGLIPVVAETLDSYLHDVWGYHIKEEHVYQALDSATSGPVAEGNVGGGTGMIAYAFKGGIGTASRVVDTSGGEYTVGVLLQANHGRRKNLRIAGVPVGEEIPDLLPTNRDPVIDKNSLVVVIATNAPLTSQQLERVARRASLGVGRNGSIARHLSGEIVLAISTGNTLNFNQQFKTLSYPAGWNGESLNPLFEATVEAVEEALVNCLVAAETMTGIDGATVYALPKERLQALLKKYNRYQAPGR